MLQQFSWGHFLVASMLLNLVWYGFVLLVYYQKEVLAFLGSAGKGSALTQAPNHYGSGLGGAESERSNLSASDVTEVSLMGSSKLPYGVEVLSSSQVAFSGGGAEGRYEQVGLVADVVQELKIIFSELEKTAGDKQNFFRLLGVVKENYGSIAGHPSIGSINAFIRERAPFALSVEELDNLWY